ncbi:hypothetical protein ABIB80_006926 [Bradyrhizobium sp. i1.15.2]
MAAVTDTTVLAMRQPDSEANRPMSIVASPIIQISFRRIS